VSRNNRHAAGLFFGMVLISSGSWGANLVDAWIAAQQNDPEFAAARADYQAGMTQSTQARALLLPQVVGTAGVGRASMQNTTEGAQFSTPAMGTSNQVDFRTSINNGTDNQWRVQAVLPLFDGANSAKSRQLNAGADLAEARYRQARQDLILRTAQAFLGVIQARENVATLILQQAGVEQTLRQTRERFRLGDLPVTDSDEAQAMADGLQAELLAAQSDLQLKSRAYQDFTQLNPNDIPALNPDGNAAPSSLAPLADWQQRALLHSPLVVMQTYGDEVAHDEIDKYRMETAPTVSLVGSVGSDRLSGSGNYGPSSITSNTRMIGLQLSIPLYSGGFRGAKFEQAIQLKEKAGFDLQSTRLWVARQVEANWLGLTVGAARVQALRQAVKSNLARMKATQLGSQNGERSTLDVLNAHTAQAQSQTQLLVAQSNLMIDRLQLDALAGELDERELMALDGILLTSP